MANDDPTEKIDPPFSNNISRRRFVEVFAGAVACVSLSPLMFGFGDSAQSQEKSPISSAGYPISSEVYTTRQWAIVPDAVRCGANTVSPWDPVNFKKYGYGLWHYVPGIDYGKDPSIMPAGYDVSSATNTASLLRFFTIADTHVYDKESPSQPFCLLMKDFVNGIPGITFTMLYTTHILDAAIQTVNALHKLTPFDCGIFLGDACNNSQYNELRWYIDVIDGKFITPSSGAHLGVSPNDPNGPIDYQQPYQAAGLDKTIPWYQTKGSHDNFWFGSNPVTDKLLNNYIGDDLLRLGDVLIDPVDGFNETTYSMGTVDGSTFYGNIIGAGPLRATTGAIEVAADPDRYSLDMNNWMSEFFNTSSNPVGHGFTQTNINCDFASYSFEPKSNIPIKVIMLDDTESDNNLNLSNYGNGSLDTPRYNWLISELEKGQSEGKLMIIATHVPIGVELFRSNRTGSWGVKGVTGTADTCVSDTDLIDTLQKYPNFILWLAGHQHNNQVKPFKSPDPNRPELGFWEVQTASLRDFPQQFRTFDIVLNTDNTISIIITDVDPAVIPGSPAAMSRFYAIAAKELYKTPTLPSTPTCTYNAELIIQLSPEMQTIIQNYGTPI
jgi:metallophosphoesterase (TIGR03768 family)